MTMWRSVGFSVRDDTTTMDDNVGELHVGGKSS